MKISIVIIIMLTAISSFGQKHIIGLKGGANYTNVLCDYDEANNEFKTGFTGGLTYEFQLNKRFVFGADLIYSQQGFKNGSEHYSMRTSSDYVQIFTYTYNYISVPLKAGVIFGDKFSGYINVGIIPSIFTHGNIVTTFINDERYEDEDKINYGRISEYDLGALIEVGASYKFAGKYFVFTSIEYKQGFVQIIPSRTSRLEGYNYGFSLSLGFKYSLN